MTENSELYQQMKKGKFNKEILFTDNNYQKEWAM